MTNSAASNRPLPLLALPNDPPTALWRSLPAGESGPLRSALARTYRDQLAGDWRDYYEGQYEDDGPNEWEDEEC